MIGYIVKRIIQRHWITLKLARNKIYDGFYFLKNHPQDPRRVVFELSDPKFVHLGDQLFYEPAMHFLKQHGIDVEVIPTKPLLNYFKQINIPVVNQRDLIREPLILYVIPLALYEKELYSEGAVLIVDFANPGIKKPLGQALIDALSTALALDVEARSVDSAVRLIPQSEIALTLPPKTIVFSNYIDSGRFRLRKSFLQHLEAKATALKALGYFIVHVGSEKDKVADERVYEFIDVDLRGATSAIDVIAMFRGDHIVGAVTYDNFVMHACLMAGKPAFVKFRGRFTSAARRHHMENVNPALAPPGSNLITYI